MDSRSQVPVNLAFSPSAALADHILDVVAGTQAAVAACVKSRTGTLNAFLNLRLSPVRMLQASEQEIYDDARGLLRAAGRRERVGVCSINMDRDTPDQNVRAMFRAVRDYEAEAV